MSERESKMQELRDTLGDVTKLISWLTTDGVTLNFNIATDQKTVDVKTKKAFEITVKGEVNQEL